MKSRLFSVLTSLILVVSLVGVMPVITASASTTFTITDLQDPDWANAFPKWTDGTSEMDDYIDATSFTRDTPMEVTVIFSWTQNGIEAGYVCVKPCSAARGWNPLGGMSRKSLGYLADMPMIDVNCSYDTKGYIVNATGRHIDYCIDKTGTLTTNDPDVTQMKFTVTAEGVNSLIDNATSSSSAYDGILIQTYAAQVTSVEVSQNGVTLASTTAGKVNPGIAIDDYNYSINTDGTVTIEKYNGLASEINIPSEINGKMVSNIGYKSFYNKANIRKVCVSNSVVAIGWLAFEGCNNLTSITIPNSVMSIGDSAFRYCDNLKDVYYTGTQEEWNNIYIGIGNDLLTGATIHFNHIKSGELKYQLRANIYQTTDVRAILIADEQEVIDADSASVYATIADYGDTDSITIKRAYRSIIAGGKKITADEGKVFLIGKFIGIPDDMLDGMALHFILGENTYERTITVY